LLLVRTLYVTTKFMICYWSKHCMLRPSLWFVTGQNTVCYDQVYDLLLVRTLYVTTKFMICYWSEHCMLRPSLWFVTGQYTMLRPSLWFVTGQSVVCYDQGYDLLLVRKLYVTTKFMICYWSERCIIRPVYDLLLVRTLYVMTKFMICFFSERHITISDSYI
jgi:hypothetical protein